MLTNNLFKRWTHKLFAPDVLQRQTYEAFKRLLEHDRRSHELLADFQDLFFNKNPTEWTKVVILYNQLSEAVGSMANELPYLSARDATDLVTYYKKFDSFIRVLLQPQQKPSTPPYIMWLDDSGMNPQLAGNKAANLGKLTQNFDHQVPKGFVVTVNSWHALLEYNDLRQQIDNHLLTLDPADHQSLDHTSQTLISLIEAATIPPEVDQALTKASQELIARKDEREQTRFAVRSSAVNEDGPNSFAGQYRSILDVSSEDLHNSYLRVLASKYSPRALLYRITAGISDIDASMAVLIIEMIKAETAGVVYTADPTGEEKDTLFLYGVTGTGEKLVDGHSLAHLSRFKKNDILKVEVETGGPTNSKEAKKLCEIAMDLENFFGDPQDIEWAIKDGRPFILQSRPLKSAHKLKDLNQDRVSSESLELSISEHNSTQSIDFKEKPTLPLLYHGGLTAAQGRGSGPVHFFTTDQDLLSLPAGAILIVKNIPASLILLLSHCNAVISSSGSVASHFATVCREFGIPLIVEATDIREKLVHGEQITVDAETCNIYKGIDKSYSAVSDSCQPGKNLPYFRRLQPILDFIVPLNILDPEANTFTPEACRSFHDIIRFAHEKGVQAMFGIGKSGSRKAHRKQLMTELPFDLYLIDVDGNWKNDHKNDDQITIDQVMSAPFRSLWRGLNHHSIAWGDHVYYNWKEYDSAAMTDGFAFKNDAESASYAICANDYLNLNIRFGYHFTIVDTLCGQNSEQNYCSIRFAGGGGTFEGRYYRLKYIETILRKLGFQVTCKTDLLDGRLESLSMDQMLQSLVTVGRMLGTSKLMDMVLKDEKSVTSHLDLFFKCNDTLAEQRAPQ